MPVTPADIYAVGAKLREGADEASLRSAVSRLYYAAFHELLDWHDGLPAPGAVPAYDAGSHQVLIHQLRRPANACNVGVRKRSVSVGTRLDELRIRRKLADYDLASTLTKAECDQQLLATDYILGQCAAPLPT